ncbi:MAG: tRNA (adenosine(37)-N6)-threonylcarbamoyltransferase complex ATPase subunit type 1 TsaE [Pseudomonadota bacterium]
MRELTLNTWLADEQATRRAGAQLAETLVQVAHDRALTVFVRGNLGAGKSTLVRGFLSALGVSGVMPSPTYSLVEPYEVADLRLFHMDAYRMGDAVELDYLGLDDLDEPGTMLLVEWPDHVRDALPAPALEIELEVAPDPNIDAHGDHGEAPTGTRSVASSGTPVSDDTDMLRSGIGRQLTLRSRLLPGSLWAQLERAIN